LRKSPDNPCVSSYRLRLWRLLIPILEPKSASFVAQSQFEIFQFPFLQRQRTQRLICSTLRLVRQWTRACYRRHGHPFPASGHEGEASLTDEVSGALWLLSKRLCRNLRQTNCKRVAAGNRRPGSFRDRNDARGIAHMMRVGLYRPVHVKTLASKSAEYC